MKEGPCIFQVRSGRIERKISNSLKGMSAVPRIKLSPVIIPRRVAIVELSKTPASPMTPNTQERRVEFKTLNQMRPELAGIISATTQAYQAVKGTRNRQTALALHCSITENICHGEENNDLVLRLTELAFREVAARLKIPVELVNDIVKLMRRTGCTWIRRKCGCIGST